MHAQTTPLPEFSVHVAPSPEGGTDVAVFGELDLSTAKRAERTLKQVLAAEGDVVIDLRACPFIDSSGIAVLLGAALRLREQERRVRIRGVRRRMMRTLEIAGMMAQEGIEIEPQEPAH